MKTVLVRLLLMQKRIARRPMFVMTWLLIPALIFLLLSFSRDTSGLILVGIYHEPGDFASELSERFMEKSGAVISYEEIDSEDRLIQKVRTGQLDCGLVLTDELEEKIREGKGGNLVTVFTGKDSASVTVIREIICGELFKERACPVLLQYMKEKQGERMTPEEENVLKGRYESYLLPSRMFIFQYADGEENTLLNQEDHNYYMMPVRGILSVLLMVAAFGGVLLLKEDEEAGRWVWIYPVRRPFFSYGMIVSTVLAAAVLSLGALHFTGLYTGALKEVLLMTAYVCLVCGYANLLRILIRDSRVICALLPVAVLMSLVFAPVFVDLSVVPGVGILRHFLPADYYLSALHSGRGQIRLAAAAVLLSFGGILLDRAVEKRV